MPAGAHFVIQTTALHKGSFCGDSPLSINCPTSNDETSSVLDCTSNKLSSVICDEPRTSGAEDYPDYELMNLACIEQVIDVIKSDRCLYPFRRVWKVRDE